MAKTRGIGLDHEDQGRSFDHGVNYLLAIGIDQYQHCTPLKNAVKDASDMASTLEQHYGFLAENIQLVIDKEATEYRIFSEFRKLIQKVKPEDNVLIFFSGHGHYDEDFRQGYWIPVDARSEAIGDFIPNSEIATTIRAIPSRHTFMIADACFSGSLFGESRSVSSKQTPSIYHQKVGSIPSRWGLASGRNEVVSDGAPGENSPFSENLIYFLKSNAHAPFTVSELVQYVKTTTANNAEQTPIGSPLRNVGDKGGEYVFFPDGIRPVLPEVIKQKFRSDHVAETTVKEDLSLFYNPNIPLVKRLLHWLEAHTNTLILTVLCTIFWGLWSKQLYVAVPIVCLVLLLSTTLFKLKGVVKTRFTLILLLVAVIEYIISDWQNLSEGGKLMSNFWESVFGRMQGHEFLWFSLGAICFGGFLYFFFKEED